MCDGGCGQFLWCDVPCVSIQPTIFNCLNITTVGILILVYAVFVYIRIKQNKISHNR